MSDRRQVTSALVSLLSTATTLPVGDHRAPAETSGKPWVTVYSIPGGGLMDDNLSATDHGVDLVYQASSAGRRRDQAEWMADLVRSKIIGRSATAFTVAWPAMTNGLAVADRQLLGGVGGVDVGGMAPHDVFTVAERFLIRLVRT